MRTVSIDDHKTADGKMDWRSYNAAFEAARKQDVDDGIYCSRCGAYLFPSDRKGRQMCVQCLNLSQPEELTHSRFVRCPVCGRASAADRYQIHGDGEHRVTCQECDHQYEVSTHVSYSFTSPARLAEANEGDEPEGGTDGAL